MKDSKVDYFEENQEVGNQLLLVKNKPLDGFWKINQLQKLFPKLYPCITGCVEHPDVGHAICGAEDLPTNDHKPGRVDGNCTAIG